MKKVLLGLLALSAAAMAAAPNLGATPTAETNVFKTGQTGAISINGTLTSEVPVIKYVVYAATDGGLTTAKEDILTLSSYVLSSVPTENKFSGTNPKVYVKRVTGTGAASTYADLSTSETAFFKLQGDPAYTTFNGAQAWVGEHQIGRTFNPTALLANATLGKILSNLKVIDSSTFNDVIVSSDGTLYINNGINAQFGPADTTKFLALTSANKGEAELTYASTSATLWNLEGMISPTLAQFAGGHPIGNAKILVKIQ